MSDRHAAYTDERGTDYQFVINLPDNTNPVHIHDFFIYLSPVALREAEQRTGRRATHATDAENTTKDGKTLRMIGHARIKATRAGNMWTI